MSDLDSAVRVSYIHQTEVMFIPFGQQVTMDMETLYQTRAVKSRVGIHMHFRSAMSLEQDSILSTSFPTTSSSHAHGINTRRSG